MPYPDQHPDSGRNGAFNADSWLAIGLPAEVGRCWWKCGFDVVGAQLWLRAGVSQPIDAVSWKIADIPPGVVNQWLDAGICVPEAIAWREFGFGLDDARAHREAGRTPVEAYGRGFTVVETEPETPQGDEGIQGNRERRRFIEAVGRGHAGIISTYLHRRWLDDEAIAWATHGLEAAEALAWKLLGVTPIEAQRLHKLGASAMETAKSWWDASVPFDEVADWIGAGLGPAEAARQRENGATVQDAAVLRSLRRGA